VAVGAGAREAGSSAGAEALEFCSGLPELGKVEVEAELEFGFG
jgi:hypothetical protein